MCEPATVTIIGAVVGATLQGYKAYEESRQAKAQAKYAQMEAEANAENVLATEAAQQRKTEYDRLKLARKSLAEEGEARAQYAASGVALGTGTANDYLADIAEAYDMDSRTLDFNYRSTIYGYEVQRTNYVNQARAYKAQRHSISTGFNTAIAGTMGAIQGAMAGYSVASLGTTLFSGASGAGELMTTTYSQAPASSLSVMPA